MSILTANRKKTKLLGVLLPIPTHTYITMYAVAKGTHKSNLTCDILTAWMKQQESPARLIKEIIDRANTQWMAQRTVYPDYVFTDYTTKLKEELLEKGLDPTDVNTIIKGVIDPWKEQRNQSR
jgi:hypothetical protein